MGEIKVNFGSLSSGAAGIGASYQALQSTLDGLESQLAPMVSTWTGDAQQAYYAQKTKWEQASAAMATILAQMGQAVDQAGSNYQQAETSNRNLWA
ncbi:WXG100 family type VII secretion target [Spongisporangium articulatum]|uniref:ESAT-6-like protein n=1 Tax=Spongisporangium articulatum TaxID=3362603 RepID=A0ABW8AV31_9ACTN